MFLPHSAFDIPKEDLSNRIRDNANIPPDILGPLHTLWQLEVIMQQYLRQQHLDLVAGEEAARASVRADAPMQLIGVVGRDELG